MTFRVLDSPGVGITPLLKWPGGKRFLLPHLRRFVPRYFQRYFEPFVGSAALFFDLCPSGAHLSDKNIELINFLQVVRDDPNGLMAAVSKLQNSSEEYYRIRDSCPHAPRGRAARFVYLSNLSFNGIYRVNRKGQFNVPYGQRSHYQPLRSQHLLEASNVLATAAIVALDFEEALAEAGAHDFVYLDPPYTVVHGSNGFLRYNQRVFSWMDQARLARLVRELHDRGCYILLSNADHPSIQRLYESYLATYRVARISRIAADSRHRRSVTEMLFTNIGPEEVPGL